MENKIIGLLEKYEDDIMKNTLGSDIYEEYGDKDEKYAEIYKWEWNDSKKCIANVLKELINYGTIITPNAFVFIIITDWTSVMTFSKGDLNIEGLEKVCEKILKELN